MTRGLGFAGVLLVSLATGDTPVATTQIALVALIAVLAQLGTIPARPLWLRYAVLIAEAAAIALVVVTSAPGDRPSIVYLAVPPIVSAFAMGAAGLASAIAVEALVLIVGTVLRVRDDLPTGVVDLIVVLALGAALGLGAVLTTHLRERIAPESTDYDSARRLLMSLRDVARQLPGGLEESALAQAALARFGSVLPHDRAEVMMRADGGRLLTIARSPEESAGWSPSLASQPDTGTRESLQRIRDELTRIVTELRLSIYDLRTEVGAGIGDALSSHVRAVGAEAGLTVHLVLDEDPTRLPPGVAPEILRIAQEAVANARRHAQARTLWVTYRVTEGSAFLRVADDGRGITEGRARPDSFGLQIMRERATRIGASLTVKRRSPQGTVVELSLQATGHEEEGT